MNIWKDVPGCGNSQRKGPEAGPCLAQPLNSYETLGMWLPSEAQFSPRESQSPRTVVWPWGGCP